MSTKEKTMLFRGASIVVIIWTLTITGLCIWDIKNEKNQTNELLKIQTRAFFQQIITTGSWNASHGGVYVPVTSKTQPNPHLEDPKGDVTTISGMKLTKIDPALMTRQIGEIAEEKDEVWFHLTSTKPIRSANAADKWELKALKSFTLGEFEFSEFVNNEEGKTLFRYMAPQWIEESCLQCHAKHGYKKGDLRGGLSVTVTAASILSIQNNAIINSSITYFCIWIFGILGIFFGFRLLKHEEIKRISIISELQESLSHIKVLSGMLPICSSCKNIRDDKGYWNKIEIYIEDHSTALFSHGMCPKCEEKLYGDQEWFKKKKKK